MSLKPLPPDKLFRHCDPSAFSFESTDEVEPLTDMIGQERAAEAVRFGMDIDQEGYNVFVLGRPGTGRRSLIQQFLEKHAPLENPPDDWCYVNNFDEPYRPKALSLPAGKGADFRDDMRQLFVDVRAALMHAFESDEYREQRHRFQEAFSTEQQRAVEELGEDARKRGLNLQGTPTGLVLTPLKDDGEPMSPDEVEQLSDEARKRIEDDAKELEKRAQRIVHETPRKLREAHRKLKELDDRIAHQAVEPLVEELRKEYHDLPKVVEHIDRVKDDLVERSDELLQLEGARHVPENQDESPERPVPWSVAESAAARSYQVNLLVERDPSSNMPPIVYEDNPTYMRVIGRVEHLQHMGTLVADFNLIRPGALHRANGGYLILEMERVLMQPLVWEGLKRALRASRIDIEAPIQAMGLMSTVSLDPEPIPLKTKVILIGTPFLYNMAFFFDPDFAELFKVPADFETAMDWNDAAHDAYARLVCTLCTKENLLSFRSEAVARVVEQSARFAGDSTKLSVQMRRIADLLCEADYWARRRNGAKDVCAEDIDRAVQAQIYRSNRVQKRLQEEIQRGTILIDTDGAQTGQVNGLAVFQFGDYAFGKPSRITARTHIGPGKVVDIEREVEFGEATHSKGVMILSGFITGRFSKNVPFSLSASLVFEQSYAGIGGDSASSAELYALLSAIAGVPLKQSFGVTGSVNQHGEIQAIGAVNEKIEGFFDVCRERGLTGEQGVVIPQSNVSHLMLRKDVRDAVADGKFHVYAVSHVDEGIELLTGVPAGEANADGEFPPDSFNGRVMARLRDLAQKRTEFAQALFVGNGGKDS